MPRKRIVLIPSYEPQISLVNLVKDIKNFGFDIVVVDDGSGAKYGNIFFALLKYAYVISYPDYTGITQI